jgi:hypothetical protein
MEKFPIILKIYINDLQVISMLKTPGLNIWGQGGCLGIIYEKSGNLSGQAPPLDQKF